MTTAQKIMKKKQFIKDEMDRQLTLKRSNFIWRKATKRLDSILDQYKDLPKGVHTHTDSFIFPAAAIYLTAKKYILAEKAYSIIENAAVANTTAAREKLVKLMKIPGMAGLFVRMWDPARSAGRCSGRTAALRTCFTRRKRMRIAWTLLRARITDILLNLAVRNSRRYSVRMTIGHTETFRG